MIHNFNVENVNIDKSIRMEDSFPIRPREKIISRVEIA